MIKSFQMTQRDVVILQFINTFGFCEVKHIQRELSLSERQSYDILKRLVQATLVQHRQIYHRRHGVYFVTKQGASFTDLPRLSSISNNFYDHHLTVIDVYQALKQRMQSMAWVSERQLIKEKFANDGRLKSHVADGLVIMDDKKIAIEVELTVKGKARIEKILKGYALKMDIDEVWYFCQPETYNVLQPFIEKRDFVKTIRITEFLSGNA